MMSDGICDETLRAIPWLLDDELDPEQSREVEAHVLVCAACRRTLTREGHLRLALRRAAVSVSVPISLRNRLHDLMERERRGSSVWRRAWPVVTALIILLSFMWHTGARDSELEDLANRHAHADLPMDVPGPSREVVESFFASKLAYAVHLPAISNQASVHLVGGRIIQVNRRDAAYVRYTLPHGRVSMVVSEDSHSGQFSADAPLYKLKEQQVLVKNVRGFSAAQWRTGGLIYSVVTDVPEDEFNWMLQSSVQQGEI